MAEIREWVNLKCDCGGELFEPLVKLKFRTGGGTTSEPSGHRCIACNGIVDNARMVRLIEIQQLRRQQSEIQAEIEAKTDATTSRNAVPVQAGDQNAARVRP